METPNETNIFHVNLTEGDIRLLYNAIEYYQENKEDRTETPEHLHHMKRIFFAMIMESNYNAADSV